ncbi:MAG: Asp23/Gls24 family envelope stress response protein [Dethiobacteria bacterium]
MADKEGEIPDKYPEIGSLRIADEVVAIIAGMTAIEVPGVAGMSGGIVGGIAEALGKKNLAKGIKVEMGEEEVVINISIIVNFGARIPDVAWEVQDNVKNAVEKLTGLKVSKVNIHVQGILFPSKKAAAEEKNTDS